MLSDIERLYKGLIEHRAEMALDVLDSPPSDWAAFQRRLGGYVELANVIHEIESVMRGYESDK